VCVHFVPQAFLPVNQGLDEEELSFKGVLDKHIDHNDIFDMNENVEFDSHAIQLVSNNIKDSLDDDGEDRQQQGQHRRHSDRDVNEHSDDESSSSQRNSAIDINISDDNDDGVPTLNVEDTT